MPKDDEKKPAAAAKAAPVLYRNISATTLTRDNGAVFAPGQTTELTDKEIARFTRAGKAAGAPYIYKVASSPSAGGGK